MVIKPGQFDSPNIKWETGGAIDGQTIGGVTPEPSTFLSTLASIMSSGAAAGGITDLALYQEVFPSISLVSAIRGLIDIPASNAIISQNAIAGFVRNKSGGAGVTGNGVCLFGLQTVETSNTAGWGINTLLQDSATRAIAALTGIILKCELDYNVMCPGTVVQGLTVTGNSLSQPASAVGFEVDSLGTGILWNVGFQTIDGVATYAALFGALSTAANSNSQSVGLKWRDASAVSQTVTMQAQSGFLVLTGTTGWGGLDILGASVFLNQGFGITIGGKTALASDGSNNTLLGNSTTGTKIQGNALGFYGATPVAVPAGYGTPTSVSKTASLAGTAATLAQVGGTLAALIADLKNQGLIAA